MKQNKIYLSYSKRLIITVVSLLVLFSLSIVLFITSISFDNKHTVNFNEKSNLDYRVYLLPNEFYGDKYLNKDMLYVASLIDKISIDFDYILSTPEKEYLDFSYDVTAKLLITNISGTKSFYEKNYTILDSKKVSMSNTTLMNIKETVDIDYAKYNKIASEFTNTYGLETYSKLVVYMNINKKSNENSFFDLNSNNSMNVEIPLSTKQVQIQLNHSDIDHSSHVIKNKSFKIENYSLLVISGVLLLVSLFFVYKLIKLLMLLKSKKNNFDKYVEKILKEYDRLIVETASAESFKKREIIKLNRFSELLDAHDNLQLPIIYCPVTRHQKCYFYIKYKNTIYLLTIKAVDLED